MREIHVKAHFAGYASQTSDAMALHGKYYTSDIKVGTKTYSLCHTGHKY